MTEPQVICTPRMSEAFSYALVLHGADTRKGSGVPYIAHLMGVSAMVLVDGGSEDEAVAGLLHDALEDHPKDTSRDLIARRFGDNVLAIVEACTDTPDDYMGGPKAPWKDRKVPYVEHVRGAGPGNRVALADKVDNARAMLADYRIVGAKLWKRFKVGRDEQLWFYRSLVDAFREAGSKGHLFGEFERLVTELENRVHEVEGVRVE